MPPTDCELSFRETSTIKKWVELMLVSAVRRLTAIVPAASEKRETLPDVG